MSSEPGILPEPVRFGKYYLLERISVGGMAEIYKAKAFGVEGFERLLAVKKILASIAENDDFIDMFIDEAKIAGQLNHPNIAQIFDLGKVDDSYFIALEYISGKDLKAMFQRSRRIGEEIDIPQICFIAMKVCEGLAHAHEKTDSQGEDLNIVHRDVSPQNILISYEGEVKIIDFGVAKAKGKTSQTQVGMLKGKFSYMSPEQVRGHHIDHRSDIFSLGIVLYEMLTLERLFRGESDFDTLEKIRKVEISPPSLYNPNIPDQLEEIVLKALSKDPDDRFQSAYKFAEALESFMRDEDYYFTNKDLANYMKGAFAEDIEFENRKLEYYRDLELDNETEQPEEDNGSEGLTWDEEEMETQIFKGSETADSTRESDVIYADELDNGQDARQTTPDSVPKVEYNPREQTGRITPVETPSKPPDAGDETTEEKTVPEGAVEPTANASQPASDQFLPELRRHIPLVRRGSSTGKKLVGGLLAFLVMAGAVFGLYWSGQKLTSYWSEPSMANVSFNVSPDEVSISIDGEPVHEGKTPFEHRVEPGETQIKITKRGYEPISLSRDLEGGTTYTLTPELEKKVQTGGLLVQSEPEGATIELDGDSTGETTPANMAGLSEGNHTIRLAKEGYEQVDRKVKISPDKTTEVSVSLPERKATVEFRVGPLPVYYTIYQSGKNNQKLASGVIRDKPFTRELDYSNKYNIVLGRRGFQRWSSIVEPNANGKIKVTHQLRRTTTEAPEPEPRGADRSPSKPPPEADSEVTGNGTLSIQSRPAARVIINGEDTDQYTPVIDLELQAGRTHRVKLVNKEFGLDKTYSVELKPGESRRIINKQSD